MKRFILSTIFAIFVATSAYAQPNFAVKPKLPDSTIKLRIDTPFVKTYVVAMPQNDVWTDRFINLVIGLVGVISGAFLSYYYAVQKGKEDTTFELFHEFNSIEMSAIRHNAWGYIKNNPSLDVQQLVDLNADNGNCILVVTRFYQKLYYNRVNRRVSERLVFELFGDVFYIWYYGFLELKLVPLGWKNGENLENLAKLFEADLSVEAHTELKKRKKQQALRDLGNR